MNQPQSTERPWYPIVLAVLESGGSMRDAAQEAGLTWQYVRLERSQNPDFARRCDEAKLAYHEQVVKRAEGLLDRIGEDVAEVLDEVKLLEEPTDKVLALRRAADIATRIYAPATREREKIEGQGKLNESAQKADAILELLSSVIAEDPGDAAEFDVGVRETFGGDTE